MDTIKINKNQTKLIAHRGLSGIETENTIAAFVAAGNRNYFGIECDIHKTTDGKFVVFHDNNTERVSNFSVDIEESDYETLKKITLNERGTKESRRDLKIPVLEDYILVCKKYNKKCVLEIKNKFEKEDIQKVIDIIKDAEYLENVIFISFGLSNLIYLRELLPKQPAQYLVSGFPDDLIEILKKYNLDLDIGYHALNAENIKKCHENGILVNCWTCDSKEDAEKLIEYGVDFITSNILE